MGAFLIEPGELLELGSGPMRHDEPSIRAAMSAVISATEANDPRRVYEVLSYRQAGHPVIAHIIGRLNHWYLWAAAEYAGEPGPAKEARMAGFVLEPVDLLTIRDRVSVELGRIEGSITSDGTAGAGPLKTYLWGSGPSAFVLAFRRHGGMNLWRPETSEELDTRKKGPRPPVSLRIGQRVLAPMGLAVVCSLADNQTSIKLDGAARVEWWATRALQPVRELGELPGVPEPVKPISPEAGLEEALRASGEDSGGSDSGLSELVSAYGATAWNEDIGTAGKTLRLSCLVCDGRIAKGDRFRAATHQGRGLRAHAACFERLAAACRAEVAAEDLVEREAIQWAEGE